MSLYSSPVTCNICWITSCYFSPYFIFSCLAYSFSVSCSLLQLINTCLEVLDYFTKVFYTQVTHCTCLCYSPVSSPSLSRACVVFNCPDHPQYLAFVPCPTMGFFPTASSILNLSRGALIHDSSLEILGLYVMSAVAIYIPYSNIVCWVGSTFYPVRSLVFILVIIVLTADLPYSNMFTSMLGQESGGNHCSDCRPSELCVLFISYQSK